MRDINEKNTPDKIKPGFSLPNAISPKYSIIFGHWASLRSKAVSQRIYVYGLDTVVAKEVN